MSRINLTKWVDETDAFWRDFVVDMYDIAAFFRVAIILGSHGDETHAVRRAGVTSATKPIYRSPPHSVIVEPLISRFLVFH